MYIYDKIKINKKFLDGLPTLIYKVLQWLIVQFIFDSLVSAAGCCFIFSLLYFLNKLIYNILTHLSWTFFSPPPSLLFHIRGRRCYIVVVVPYVEVG